MAKTSRLQRGQGYQASGRRTRAIKKRNDDQPWSEKDVFDLGIRLGFSGARDLGREQVIAEVAKSLKRRVDEVQSKLVELGFIRDRAGRSRRTEARKLL
jgi:hypothetical protein